jgi:hypothetical protein
MIILYLIFAFGFAFLIFSFVTWSREQTTVFGVSKNSRQWQPTRAYGFALLALAWPIYLLWDWYSLPQLPSNLAAYQYERKLWTDLWAPLTILLGLLFGVRR